MKGVASKEEHKQKALEEIKGAIGLVKDKLDKEEKLEFLEQVLDLIGNELFND